MTAYYNEIDPYAAQWLRNLIDAGHIARGDVDERSIVDVRGSDLAGYDQCHFFAGIGGWSLALRLAGWPDDRSVWTGSCPCQPFSAAGAGKAADDERHLWPAWFPLIAERRPAIVFGEQVDDAIGWGWLDLVFVDLEAEGYACGAAILPACGVGAPHNRARAWFVADANGGREHRGSGEESRAARADEGQVEGPFGERLRLVNFGGGATGGLADADGWDTSAEGLQRGRKHGQRPEDGRALQLGNPNGARRPLGIRLARDDGAAAGPVGREATQQAGDWGNCDWLPCTDGKARPVEPGSFPLAHGIQRRASKLRAYGNAIVPQVAAEFIRAIHPCH